VAAMAACIGESVLCGFLGAGSAKPAYLQLVLVCNPFIEPDLLPMDSLRWAITTTALSPYLHQYRWCLVFFTGSR
jgi:hypothetical protein